MTHNSSFPAVVPVILALLCLGSDAHAAGAWSSTGGLATPRRNHTATLLRDGRVLVVGGDNAAANCLAAAELYDPATGSWTAATSLATARTRHTATLLNDGRVFVASGLGMRKSDKGKDVFGSLDSVEIYDPTTGLWWATTSPLAGTHLAVFLGDGRVLLVQGTTAAIFAPVSLSWSAAAGPSSAHDSGAVLLLATGRVLLVGGTGGAGDAAAAVAGAELFDSAAGAWSATGSLAAARSLHTLTLLASGKALAAGGQAGGASLAGAEVYDPVTGSWNSAGSLAAARSSAAAALLDDGRALIVGGSFQNTAELYDPAAAWSPAATLAVSRSAHTATRLGDGSVLVAGGQTGTDQASGAILCTPAAELYVPAAGGFRSVSAVANGVGTAAVMVGTPVTFTYTPTPAGPQVPKTVTWSFGDGDALDGNPVNHTYTLPGSYIVSATATDGITQETTRLTLVVYAPASGGTGQTIVSQDVQLAVANPLTGVKLSVANSNGGVVELLVDVQALVREDFVVLTDFRLPGRQVAPPVEGLRPVASFTTRGLAVATAAVTRNATGANEGRARLMLPLSAFETDDPELPHLPKPSPSAITLKSLKGKFNFAGKNDPKPDSVSLAGTIKLPAGLDLSRDQELWIGVGNIVDRVTVDTKGAPKAKSKGDRGRIAKLKIKWPRVTATQGGEEAAVTATLMLPDMDKEGFDTEGITNALRPEEAALKSVSRQVQVALVLAGVAYEVLSPADFKLSKKKDTGQISLPRR